MSEDFYEGIEALPIFTGEEDPVLRKKSKAIKRINNSTRELLDQMAKTMYAAGGVGLAAPQIGINKRIIVLDVGEGLIELINPEVTMQEGEETALEGCLSLPDLIGEVTRGREVEVKGYDRQGRQIWVRGEGLLSRALQHEIDHLDGILFIDKAKKVMEIPPESKLRVVFMGTPEFAEVSLKALVENRFGVMAVVTNPDRPKGRGKVLTPSPVKELANSYEIPVFQPKRARDPEFIEQIRAMEPDVIVVVAYGKILPKEILDIPRYGCINVHGSLLPEYRGAAPIHRAIMDGKEVTGITTMFMAEGMDTGDMILKKEIPVNSSDTGGSLHDKLAKVGAELLVDTLRLFLEDREVPRVVQDDSLATYAPKLTPEDEVINWHKDSESIVNQIRALDPWPGATATLRGKAIKLYAGEVVEGIGTPGEIIDVLQKVGIIVATGSKAVLLKEIKPANGKRMPMSAFLNGHDLKIGERL